MVDTSQRTTFVLGLLMQTAALIKGYGVIIFAIFIAMNPTTLNWWLNTAGIKLKFSTNKGWEMEVAEKTEQAYYEVNDSLQVLENAKKQVNEAKNSLQQVEDQTRNTKQSLRAETS